MLPTAIGWLWMLGIMAAFDISFNVANIVALPLVLGIGIDAGAHIMHRFEESRPRWEALAGFEHRNVVNLWRQPTSPDQVRLHSICTKDCIQLHLVSAGRATTIAILYLQVQLPKTAVFAICIIWISTLLICVLRLDFFSAKMAGSLSDMTSSLVDPLVSRIPG